MKLDNHQFMGLKLILMFKGLKYCCLVNMNCGIVFGIVNCWLLAYIGITYSVLTFMAADGCTVW